VFVASATQDVRPKTWEIVARLRQAGVSTGFDLKDRSLEKQLEYADSVGIPYVVIVGKKELEKGFVKLRDMKNRREREIVINEIQKEL